MGEEHHPAGAGGTGGLHVRAVEYDPPSQDAEWEPFPFPARDAGREASLRAVFAQPKADSGGELTPGAGRVVSPAHKVVLGDG